MRFLLHLNNEVLFVRFLFPSSQACKELRKFLFLPKKTVMNCLDSEIRGLITVVGYEFSFLIA